MREPKSILPGMDLSEGTMNLLQADNVMSICHFVKELHLLGALGGVVQNQQSSSISRNTSERGRQGPQRAEEGRGVLVAKETTHTQQDSHLRS